MRLQLSALAEGDEVLIRLNGHELGAAEPTKPLGSEPDKAWVALEPDPKRVKEGYNIVEVKLVSKRDVSEMPMIDRLDLTVRYK